MIVAALLAAVRVSALLVSVASAEPAPPAQSAAPAAAPSLVGFPAVRTEPGPASAPAAHPGAAAPESSGAMPAMPYRFVPYPPKDPTAPRIFAVHLNGEVLKAPGPIDIEVDTSPDVVKVIEHNGKRAYPIPMVAPGRFASQGQIPKVPFIAHGVEVKLDFEAVNASGKSTSTDVPFKLK